MSLNFDARSVDEVHGTESHVAAASLSEIQISAINFVPTVGDEKKLL